MNKVPAILAVLLFIPGAIPCAGAQNDIRPGRWELNVEMTVPDAPGFGTGPLSIQQCVTPEQAANPAGLIAGLSNPGASSCSLPDKRESPGHLDFTLRCEGNFGISGRGAVDFTPDSFRGTLNLDFSAGAGSPGRTASVSRISGKRLGGC